MADEKKKVAGEVDQATTDAKKAAAEKVKKASKGNKKTKENKPNIFVRMGNTITRFFKDFRGESKKIVWPDGRTVLKSSLIVIVVVALVAVVVFGIDSLLAFIVKSLQNLATTDVETTLATTEATTEATTAAAGMIGFFSSFLG